MKRILCILVICCCISQSRAQVVFDIPFDFNKTHIDLEFHHPVTLKTVNATLFEGLYILRAVFPISQNIQLGIEQPIGNWTYHDLYSNTTSFSEVFLGNTTLMANFALDSTHNYSAKAIVALPTASSGAERNILADPRHVYRSAPDALTIIGEATAAYRSANFYYGGTAGLQFYKYTGKETVTDDPAGYISLQAAAGFENAKTAAGLFYHLLYYTGETLGFTPFTNMIGVQAVLKAAGLRPSLTLEIPLDEYLSSEIPVLVSLRISFVFR